jgi:hypothetical protein
MNTVRLISLLLAGFLAFAAYMTPSNSFPFLAGSGFFILMAYLSIRNAGAADSPYIYFAFSAAAFFYSFLGLATGEYSWRRHSVDLQSEPQLFWAIFVVTFLLGIGVLGYGYAQIKKRKPN